MSFQKKHQQILCGDDHKEDQSNGEDLVAGGRLHPTFRIVREGRSVRFVMAGEGLAVAL
jgi:hypothetical protein